jgi:flagellin-like protein
MKIVIRDDEKKDKAVSAIIGTILIVAITVVLAATLYAVLGGFSGLIGKPTPSVAMEVSSSGVGSANEIYVLSFTSVSQNVSMSDVSVHLTTSSGTSIITLSSSASAPGTIGDFAGTYSNAVLSVSSTITIYGDTTPLTGITLVDTSTGGTLATVSNL